MATCGLCLPQEQQLPLAKNTPLRDMEPLEQIMHRERGER